MIDFSNLKNVEIIRKSKDLSGKDVALMGFQLVNLIR